MEKRKYTIMKERKIKYSKRKNGKLTIMEKMEIHNNARKEEKKGNSKGRKKRETK